LLGVKSVGVDYGLVRTGLASTIGYSPKALAILQDLNTTQVCHEIVRHCRAEQASQIVVGLPLHKNGTEAEQTNLTRIFATELATIALQKLGPSVPVYMWDERYTSKEAAARAHSQNPDRYLYGTLDAEAACIILENFYHDNGKDAQRVSLVAEVEEECLKNWDIVRAEEEQKLKSAVEQRLKSSTTRRQEAMERARQLEADMARDGTLGESRKKKKQKKKKREKRGQWLVPGTKE
jgi:putative Holliday junction resolvase